MKRLLLAAAMACMFVSAARATEVDMSTVLKDPDGKAMTDCTKWSDPVPPPAPPQPAVCLQVVDLTLGALAYAVVNRPEANLGNDEQNRRGTLARRLKNARKLDLSADDIKLIKDLIYKMGYSPVLVVTAVELLDPVSLKK